METSQYSLPIHGNFVAFSLLSIIAGLISKVSLYVFTSLHYSRFRSRIPNPIDLCLSHSLFPSPSLFLSLNQKVKISVGMALATLGESVVSKIIDGIVDKASSFLQENLLPAGDTEAELERLKYALPQIKAVLAAVEGNQIKTQYEALDAWHWEFRDAVDCAEDVLDELSYYELEEKVQAQNNQVSGLFSGYKRKFDNYVTRKFKEDTRTRLVKAVKGLDKAVAGVGNFLNLDKWSGSCRGKNYKENVKRGDDRETGPLLTESIVFGRDKERDLIVEWLTVDPVVRVGDAGLLSAFTILGVGGLGKTTLAQLICRDERVRQFFDQIIWVCVSDNFDAVEIIIKILELITKERAMVRSLASLQEDLEERLSTNKFLLVMDDVWNDTNRSQWESLVAPLKFGHAQSKILLTSRMRSVVDMVAKVIEGKNDYHQLDGLEKNQFLTLFNKHAFAGVDPDEFKNLLSIGKQIAEKLGGCPLAAKVMGGVLNYSMEFDYWNKVLKDDVSNFQSGMGDIMAVLRLSYKHLPPNLKLCFRYCSIFPKDYQFEKDGLIKMWMGSGLIDPVRNRYRPEDVGGEYFNRLVRKSFFEPMRNSFRCCYVMHDLLHDLATYVSKGECLRAEEDSGDVPETIRHLDIQIKSALALREITHLKNLRTFCIRFGNEKINHEDIKAFSEILKRFKSLRLLSITWRHLVEAPAAIGELIHLRYLSFGNLSPRRAQVPWFHPSAYRLYHLEVLKFVDSIIVDGIDKRGISNLVNLRYLDAPDNFVTNIPDIGKLFFLQELNHFVVGEGRGYQINELGSLKNLRKLCIMDLKKANNFQKVKEARLSEKEYLKDLVLCWSSSNGYSSEEYEQLLNNLRPNINLEMLKIDGYGGARSPNWMAHVFLVNLTSLKLKNCSRLSILPALGKLPMLKHLELNSFPEIKTLDCTFYGNCEGCSFPVLKELMFCDLKELDEWVEVEGITVFPRLEILQIYGCPKLRRLPSLPPSLRKLELTDTGIIDLPRVHQNIGNEISSSLSSLSHLSIDRCRNILSLDGCLLQQLEHMQALSTLHIMFCSELVHFPSMGFVDLNSLKELSIGGCPMLAASSTQENLLPSSLQFLYIGSCGANLPLLGSLTNLTLLTKLKLINCRNMIYLPSSNVMSALTALSTLFINGCKELLSLSGLEALTSLRRLYIQCCDKLVTKSSLQPQHTSLNQGINASGSSLMLDELYIDHSSLLLLEPLRSLELTKELVLGAPGNLTSLPEKWLLQNRSSLQSLIVHDVKNLEHLPDSIERMRFLEKLTIGNAPLIQSLPDFPLSLQTLDIFGCHPLLKEQYKKDGGVEWHRIAHINTVTIVEEKRFW